VLKISEVKVSGELDFSGAQRLGCKLALSPLHDKYLCREKDF